MKEVYDTVSRWEVEGIRQRGRPKKTWWDCVKNDMVSLGLSQKDAQSRINGEGELRGQPANPGSPGKMAVYNGVCVWCTRPVSQWFNLFQKTEVLGPALVNGQQQQR